MSGGRGEFDLIARYFAPLAGPEGLGLADDAALMPGPPDGEVLVVTCDTMVAGVHFLPDDPADAIGHKLLAVNLSDLAAMGATPSCYLLATSWPSPPDDAWLTGLTDGLRRMQEAYGIRLIGGDTTRTGGPLTLTLTAIGHVGAKFAMRRSTARAGDPIFVSGTIGDAALALCFTGNGASPFLRERLLRPTPRVALGRALHGIATAAMDVSDGLIGDLVHIAEQSKVGAVVDAAKVPLSEEAAAMLAADPELMRTVLGGGDDYELLFTAAPEDRAAVMAAAAATATAVTEIGLTRAAQGVVVLDRSGEPLALDETGFRHF
ncbi:MAG: thiamine-phosphate kinase [Alphaproteobacteria bacterium]